MKLVKITDDKFHVLMKKISNEPLPLKTAFKIKGIYKKIQEEYAKYDEVRQQALLNYGLKDSNGNIQLDEHNNVRFDDLGRAAFNKDMVDLLSTEINVENIKLSELGDNLKLSAIDLELLDGLLIE